MWVLIDNYDSFTHILCHYLKSLHEDILVVKNDEISVLELTQLAPQVVILSPGPQRPQNAGITMQVIEAFIGKIPILGVCLGHQALGEYLGAHLVHAQYPMHGKQSTIRLIEASNILGLPPEMEVMRYHSLVLEQYEKIIDITPLALAADDASLMMFYSNRFRCFGIQFHPESVGTPKGMEILKCWQEWAFGK
jgi:anthranilate synthase component 2